MSQVKPPVLRLGELAPGQRADFFALLVERKPGLTREGKPYYHCRFRDDRRTVSFMAWADDRWYEPCQRDWQAGQFYKLRAIYQEHERYGPQVELVAIRAVNDEDRADGFDESQFVESSRHDLGHLFGELRTAASKHILDEALRNLVLALLDRHAERLKALPATRDRAYSYRGGWLEHTLSVTRIAVDLAERYAVAWPDLRPPLNRDLVTAGAILHDIGRLRELDDDSAAVGQTVEGRLFGAALLGRDLVRDLARERGDVAPELLMLLEHVLLTPPGSGEAAAGRGPLVIEGLIVQHAADLDLKVAAYARLLTRDAGSGPFTERDPALGRALLKARAV